MIECKICLIEKTPDAYSPNRRVCKDCRKIQHAEYRSNPETRERRKADMRRWYEANKETKVKKYRIENIDPQRDQRYRRTFNISLDRYNEMLAKQGGVCAICSTPPAQQMLAVDHDHSCCPGKTSCGSCVRGLLCSDCNTSLGKFKDSKELLP